MIDVGTKLTTMPVELKRVRDLEAHDGPILTEFRAANGDLYLYLWCDEGSGRHRWLVFRTAERDLIRYMHRAVTLRHLVEQPLGGYFFVVDTDNDGVAVRSALATRQEIPADYWPAGDSYHEPALSVPTAKGDRTRPVLINGEWTIDDFGLFPRRYSNVYSFLYIMGGNGGADTLPAPFDYRFEHGRGFPIAAFFRGLRQAIPAPDRPTVQAVQYASPGFIRFKLEPRIGDAVAKTVAAMIRDAQKSTEAYNAVQNWYQARKLVTAKVQTETLSKLVGALGIIRYDRIESVLPSGTSRAAVVSSYYRFVRHLARYVQENRAEFLADASR